MQSINLFSLGTFTFSWVRAWRMLWVMPTLGSLSVPSKSSRMCCVIYRSGLIIFSAVKGRSGALADTIAIAELVHLIYSAKPVLTLCS